MPYLGYFQLIDSVDKFVFLDDVNFIKKGWINRNRILCDGTDLLFSIPLSGASRNRKINEIPLAIELRWKKKFFATIERAYRKAPYFSDTFEMLTRLIEGDHSSIGGLAKASVQIVTNQIGIATEFVESSSAYGNNSMVGQQRIIDICCKENAGSYINAENGRSLYEGAAFQSRGVDLKFVSPNLKEYNQNTRPFVPGLSVLDALMYVPAEQIRQLLSGYEVAS